MEALFVGLGICCCLLAYVIYLWRQVDKEKGLLEQQVVELRTKLEQQQEHFKEKLDLVNESHVKLKDSFKSISYDILKTNSQSFLDLATARIEKMHEGSRVDIQHRHKAIDELIKPIKETLQKVGDSHHELKKSLAVTHTSVAEQIKGLATAQSQLQTETSNLVKALRMPNVRGRWGEMQLKRVVEIAGMVEHCDFEQQASVNTEEGRLRPDMVIKLPGEKQIVIDSKTPLQAYLNALEATDDDTRLKQLKEHARQVRTHIVQLSSKAYWDQFKSTPDFVVLFLPGETFFSAALEQDPTLIEYGIGQKVILATPTTLIALLRSVAYGWRQEVIAENAQIISELGKVLYERIQVLSSHFVDMRKGLDRAIDSYNKCVGSFETRVLVSAQKLKETGIHTKEEIEAPTVIEKTPRKTAIRKK